MTYERRKIPMSYESRDVARAASGVLLAGALLGAALLPDAPARVSVRLTEWKVELSQGTIAPGTVRFAITNAGSIPHAFEVGGQGLEKQTAIIQPGASGTLTLDLKPGSYEVYCPVGDDSHKKLGMVARLSFVGAHSATPPKVQTGFPFPITRCAKMSLSVPLRVSSHAA